MKLLKKVWVCALAEKGVSGIITTVIIAGVAFLILGIMFNISGAQLISGFDALRNAPNASAYTGFVTTVQSGPTLIILGFIISVAIAGFMGLKVFGKKSGE